MIGTAFSMLIRMELAAPGVQYLNGDHQLYNGAPSNAFSRWLHSFEFLRSSWFFIGASSPDLLFGFCYLFICFHSVMGYFNIAFIIVGTIRASRIIRKALDSLSGGQPHEDLSMSRNLPERMVESYGQYGEVNELLSTCNTGLSFGCNFGNKNTVSSFFCPFADFMSL